jgi:catechol 2,3-dioxygenase-like lactoylglutathione lyase family enzyme
VAAGHNFRSSGAHRALPITPSHFEVSDIEAAVRELEERDVRFIDYGEGPLQTTGHIAQIGPARAAWFRDPDGNTLGLRQA